VLAQTSTSPQDAALFAEMLSPPNDGSLPPKASNSSKRSPPAGAAPSLCSIAPVPHVTRMVEKHYGHLATSYVREAIRAAKPLGIGEAAKIIPLAGTR
jgi:hypothetical protein